jgi:hypothetical protein
LSRGEGAVDIGITSPQYEQLTVTYHLSGSMGSFTACPALATVTWKPKRLQYPVGVWPSHRFLPKPPRRWMAGLPWAQPICDCAHLLCRKGGAGPDHSALVRSTRGVVGGATGTLSNPYRAYGGAPIVRSGKLPPELPPNSLAPAVRARHAQARRPLIDQPNRDQRGGDSTGTNASDGISRPVP